jgi:hypothetical protein
MEEKIYIKYPGGKQGVNISKAKYTVIRDAILETLCTRQEIGPKELTQAVSDKLQGKFDGSIPWYVTTVKLDLEAHQTIKNVSSRGLQRLQLA